MELILIRHGLPVHTLATDDPPLAEEGRDQADKVAAWLAPDSIDAIYSSSMQRAIETAGPLTALKGHPLQIHHGIVEFDRGSGSYVPMETLKREDYAAWQAFVAGNFPTDMPSFQKVVVDALEEIIGAHGGKSVAVFCHGGVINVWTAHVLGIEPRLFFEPAYTSVHRYLCARSGQRNIVSLNETAHLRASAA